MWIVSSDMPRRTPVLVALVVALAACADTGTSSTMGLEMEVSAAKGGVSTVNAGASLTSIEEFVQAQGTYCNPDPQSVLPCHPTEEIGYILALGRGPVPDEYFTIDIGNVNRRYWELTIIDPALAPYTARGTVSESRLHDGRRRLIINMNVENTATELYTSDNINVLGAFAFEYPGVTPMLADVSAHIELVLPADFPGMPDLLQVLAEPTDGMELRMFSVRLEGEGELRVAYDGMAPGTRVRLTGKSTWLRKLGFKGVKSERLMLLDYDPTSRITVTPIR